MPYVLLMRFEKREIPQDVQEQIKKLYGRVIYHRIDPKNEDDLLDICNSYKPRVVLLPPRPIITKAIENGFNFAVCTDGKVLKVKGATPNFEDITP